MFAGHGRQVTVFLGESDVYHHQPLHMAILERLRREGCGGATVTRGVAGFGAHSRMIHTASILRLSTDMPIVVTIVDRPDRIERVLPILADMAPHALIVAEDVEIVHAGVPLREGLPDLPVSEVMRRDVVTVQPDSTVATMIDLLLNREFTALPVVDRDRRLVGIVSEGDVLERTAAATPQQAPGTAPAFVGALHDEIAHPQRQVSEIMTREVVTVSPETSLGAAARLMADRELKRLPVVDGRQRLVGILSRLDVLNTLAAVHLPEWHAEASPVGAQAVVSDVMERHPATATRATSVAELVNRLMASAHKRVVIIDEQRRVLGIVADRDLLSRAGRQTAGELIVGEPIAVRAEMPVATALALSAEKRVKVFPVVDADGRLLGVVGRGEMLRALMRGR